MNRLDWLKAIRRGLSANAVIAIGAFTTYLFSDGVVSAAAIAVLLLDAMSAAVFLLSSYLGKTAAEMALVMTVLSVIVMSTAGVYLVSYLFSDLPEHETPAVETEADPPAYFEEPEPPIETMEGNQSPSPDDLPAVITEKHEEYDNQDESQENEVSSEDAQEATEAEEEITSAPGESIIEQEPIAEEPVLEETAAEPIVEAVIEDEPEEVIAEPVAAEEPVEETSEPVITEEPIEEAQEITAAEEVIEEEDETATAIESSEFAADDFFAGLSEDEAAFWADFYIAGEDELILDDGRYYLGLNINGAYLGVISSEVMAGEISISRKELLSYISDYLTDSAIERLFSDESEYLSLSSLEEKGVGCEFISDDYGIYLTFDNEDMPVQILSIRSSSPSRRSRPIADAIDLDPAVFAIRSTYDLSADFTIYPFENFNDSLRFKFSVSNEARLYDVHFLFDYDFIFGTNYFDFDFGPYRFYTDIGDEGLRLSWGNISTDLLYTSGTSVGIRLEKDFSFASSSVKRRSHIERTISIEKESEVQILNEGQEIFNRVLGKGNYRLTDFILFTGANRIEIIIKPLDGSPEIRYEMDVNYQSSLLAPGEIYFSLAAATDRKITRSDSEFHGFGFRIPWLNNQSLEYDFRNITISGTLDAGVTENFTINAELALQNKANGTIGWNPSGRISVAMTHANILGTTRYNFRLSEYSRAGIWAYPDVYARIGHQISTGNTSLSTISLGLSYNMNSSLEHDTELSLSLSGKLGIFNWNTSISGGYDNGDIPWAVSGSISLSPMRNMRLSLNARVHGTNLEVPSFSGRVYFSYMFGGGVSANASASTDDFTAAVTVNRDKNSFYTSITGSPMLSPQDYDAYASYTYNGDYLGFSADFNAIDFIGADRQFTGSVSVSTSSVFADGLLAFSRTIPSNYLLIKQDKYLKGNEMSIGIPSASSVVELDKQINETAIYKSVNDDTYLTVYSTPSESFGNTSYYNLHLPADGDGYVYRIEAEELYAASGVVEFSDGFIWINGASPLYSVELDEAGSEILRSTEIYIFSDSEGRFVVSGLRPGAYAFDISCGDEWFLMRFSIESNLEDISNVYILSSPELVEIIEDSSCSYSAVFRMNYIDSLNSEEFWNYLYPADREVVNE